MRAFAFFSRGEAKNDKNKKQKTTNRLTARAVALEHDHERDGRVVPLLELRARVPQGLVLGLEHLVELVLGDAVAVEHDRLGLLVAVGGVCLVLSVLFWLFRVGGCFVVRRRVKDT